MSMPTFESYIKRESIDLAAGYKGKPCPFGQKSLDKRDPFRVSKKLASKLSTESETYKKNISMAYRHINDSPNARAMHTKNRTRLQHFNVVCNK